MSLAVEICDPMIIERDVAIVMDDGVVLRADVFRPLEDGAYPVLMTYGPYGKGLHFEDGYPAQWALLTSEHPEVLRGTSGLHANWETVDPERWVPNGYVVIRVDSRGTGRSPGYVDPFSARETRDYYNAIEWAGVQPWSNGKVGLLGVSYYAMNQWQVAALHPPHLAAICPFEGASDYYRDAVRHGGMLCTFWSRWYPRQVETVQHGLGSNGPVSRATGRYIAGDETLDTSTLQANRTDIEKDHLAHIVIDDWFKERIPDLSQIEVPLLSCGNWGGQGLHLRGNIEGYMRAGSQQKWLEMHGLEHWTEFYTDYGVDLQKRFFDHFLKGEDNGWDRQPPVQLQLRTPTGFIKRHQAAWPLPGTRWSSLSFDLSSCRLGQSAVDASASFIALQENLTLWSEPFECETEITGPVEAIIFASSTTVDMDLFLTLRLFDPDGREVFFVGAVEPNAPVTQGWLRASHRAVDPLLSKPGRPWHTHDRIEPTVPGKVYELAVELWPTSIMIPPHYRLALTIGGGDFDHGLEGPMPHIYGYAQRGSSVYVHDNSSDRPKNVFGGTTTIYGGVDCNSRLLLPVIAECSDQ